MEAISGKKVIKGIIKAVITSTALTMDYSLVADDISVFGYANPETFLTNLSKLLYAIKVPTIVFFLLTGFLTFFMYRYLTWKHCQGVLLQVLE